MQPLRIAELDRLGGDINALLDELQGWQGHMESENAVLAHRASHDMLTALPNRAAFEERLHEELERWKRFRTPVSMLVWDIDRFKKINDTYGHRAGDRVLREVANCFANRLRASDFIARIGGEEFCTLLVGTETEAALRVANELREAVAGLKLLFHGQPVRVTVSCGVTSLRDSDGADGGTIFERADAALYRAKDGGRNLCIAA